MFILRKNVLLFPQFSYLSFNPGDFHHRDLLFNLLPFKLHLSYHMGYTVASSHLCEVINCRRILRPLIFKGESKINVLMRGSEQDLHSSLPLSSLLAHFLPSSFSFLCSLLPFLQCLAALPSLHSLFPCPNPSAFLSSSSLRSLLFFNEDEECNFKILINGCAYVGFN